LSKSDRSAKAGSPKFMELCGLTIAYLVNQYPAPSHSFIRRGIIGLRRAGVSVRAFSIRRYPDKLLSESDLQEAAKTRVILDAGCVSILFDVLRQCLISPRVTLRSLRKAIRLGWRSERGILRHLAYFAEACVLLRWLRECGAEHVHAHFGTNSADVAMLCHWLGGPTWSLTVHGPEEFVMSERISLREKVSDARFVVGISEFGIQSLRQWCAQAQWEKLKLVRCGIDEGFAFQPITPVPDASRIVCIGRLCERKIQHVLIEAVHQLMNRGMDVMVTLVGDGPAREGLEKQVDAHGLGSQVRFAGWCSEEEVRAQILAARGMVLPSRDEGLPVAIMEAFALGRPVISTSVAGIPELVESRRSGWLVEPGNANALANAIEEMLRTSPQRLAEMAAIGKDRVLSLHHADRNARILAALFQTL
jgi:colanic acid/amylovoran biosynthesis glycosyltransferase